MSLQFDVDNNPIPEAEQECCPTCGIQRYYLERAHPNGLAQIDACADDFHNGREERLRRAREWAEEAAT